MSYNSIVPHASVFIDATWKEFLQSASWCIKSPRNHKDLTLEIQQIFKNHSNQNSIIPCLSVRSGLDLFLSVHPFPPGSEVIMSAINIPTIVEILHYHGLEVVSLDVDILTMKPKIELLESLVTSKSQVLLLANIYGRGYDVEPFIKIAKKHGLVVIEDWAEGFSGLDYLGHPDSDLSLFSFGPIKYCTAFGGAIAKIKDINVYHRMKNLFDSWPVLSHYEYLTKIMKLSVVYLLLNCPLVIKQVIYFSRKLGVDHKKKVVSLLRGYPNDLIKKIRHRPCDALLATLKLRLSEYDRKDFLLSNVKAEYALANMPSCAMLVGREAAVRNHWLFPVIVKNPHKVIAALNDLGVDAYSGATQLNIVRSDRPSRSLSSFKIDPRNTSTLQTSRISHVERSEVCKDEEFVEQVGDYNPVSKYCDGLCDCSSFQTDETQVVTEAEFLIRHVIYLPVNKMVPFREIDKICLALARALDITNTEIDQAAVDQCVLLENEFTKSLDFCSRHKIKSKL